MPKTLQDITVSLELAKELKEAGYEQESLFIWVDIFPIVTSRPVLITKERFEEFIDGSTDVFIKSLKEVTYSAPTATELLERLPIMVNFKGEAHYLGQWQRLTGETAVRYKSNSRSYIPQKIDKNEANARAKMWLYLKMEGLLDNA